MKILILLIILFIIYLIIKHYFRKEKTDTCIMFSGGLGTGKTYNAVRRTNFLKYESIKAIRKLNKSKKSNYDFKVYSNFPIQYKYKGKWIISERITFKQMILQEPLNPECIVVIDEFGSWINQFDYKAKNIEKLDEHIRLWRHYHGNKSHLIVADQCSNNIVLQLRRRFNKVINCVQTKFYLFGLFHITNYRVVNISEEVKTIEEINNNEADTDDNILRYIGFHIPKILGLRRLFRCRDLYNDRAYSNRYNKAFLNDLVELNPLKTDLILKWDNQDYENLIEKGIEEYDKKIS